MKSKVILILAVLMGVITTVLFFDYMKKFDEQKVMSTTLTEVVTAKQAIKENQAVTASMLQTVQLPAQGVHGQAVKSIAEVEGKFAAGAIEAGEIVLSHRIKDARDEALFVSKKVQDGYRAVSVSANFVQSVSNLIEPEDYVDVISTPVPKNGEEADSRLILEKVRVLAIGRRMVKANAETTYAEYSAVTLELKPQETVTLVEADERGSISLTLHTKIMPPTSDGK